MVSGMPDSNTMAAASVAVRAPTHQGDTGDPLRQVGSRSERQRDVGERSGRHQEHVVVSADRVDDERDGIGAVWAPLGLGERGAVEAALTVHERSVLRLHQERPLRPRVHRGVDLQPIAHEARVVGRAVEGSVAGHGGDAQEIGVGSRDDDRDDVVVPGVAVEHDARSLRHAANYRA
jgi:hypothetical protein